MNGLKAPLLVLTFHHVIQIKWNESVIK